MPIDPTVLRDAELKTPAQWAAEDGIVIMDPDGWRRADDPPFDQPITKAEYFQRVAISTVRIVDRAGAFGRRL